MPIRKIYLAAIFLMALLLSGCSAVKLVADYDSQIDKGVTALQKNMETFLVKLESAPGEMAAPYQLHYSFYGKTRVEISSLRVRADALERNSLTVRMLDSLQANVDGFGLDHQEGLHKKELALYRGGFNSQFTAILTFELAKKRGEKPDEKKALLAATPNTSGTGSIK